MNLPQLARKTIEARSNSKSFEPDKKTKDKYTEEKACFVTLTKNNELRGCIGSLRPEQQLWKEVQENAINSAFHDQRFPSLQKDELKKIKIEVSVLTKSQKLIYENEKDLLKKLNKNMGLILEKGFYSSTFLPQVWRQIPDKRQFLEHLSMKSGLDKDAWKTSGIYFYTVNVEKEN